MAEEVTSPENQASKLESASESGPQQSSVVNESEIDNLRQQLAAQEAETKANYDRYVRQVAELENYKKRTARERDDSIRYANESLIKDLLPVVDNLERALAHGVGNDNGKSLVDGIEMVRKGFIDAIGRHGVTQIAAVGEPFDPTRHEAIAQIESVDLQPNMVIEAFNKGYIMRERLLRPALVTVSKSPINQEKKNPEAPVENPPSDD
jgi:molecular chaperone GrpE